LLQHFTLKASLIITPALAVHATATTEEEDMSEAKLKVEKKGGRRPLRNYLTKPKICTAVHIFLENILEHPRPSENIIYIFSLNNILCVRYKYYFVRQ
jgi:hypothetical protein